MNTEQNIAQFLDHETSQWVLATLPFNDQVFASLYFEPCDKDTIRIE